MSLPGLVDEHLGGETVTARVSLGGEDELFVTPTRTLVYRGEGLLRDESIDEYSHDVERMSVTEGRRKTRFTLEYAIDGEKEFTIPTSAADEAMTPLLEGVLHEREIIDDEEVVAAYRFSELSLAITDRRLVKHVGTVLFDPDFEEFQYADVTSLNFEQGSVAMQIVLTVDGRAERIKAPNDRASEVRMRLEKALQEFYDVNSNEELKTVLEPDDDGDEDASDDTDEVSFNAGIDPLGSDDSTDRESDPEPVATPIDGAESGERAGERTAESRSNDLETAGFETAETTDESTEELRVELESLREAVERQNELLAKQQETIDQLIEELSRGR